MKKAVIFDMDGTTVNTLDSIAYHANQSLGKVGLPSIDTESYKMMIGNGIKNLVHRMVEALGGTPEQEAVVYTDYATTYDQNYLYLARPYDGILPLLDELKSRGIKVGIVSNKPDFATKNISRSLFGDLIDVTYGGRPGVPLKPDPKAVLDVLQEWNLSPADCLYVGDSGVDMLTGKAAGIFTVGVLWGFRGEEELRENGADALVSHPAQLLDYLEQ